jgi:hypothetical protein
METVDSIVCRISVSEKLYRPNTALPSLDRRLATEFGQQIDVSFEDWCCRIVEFQARAICYLDNHRIVQILQDMFALD